jgi:hypothetical protein
LSNAEILRLLQAVEHFKARTRGAELPKGAQDALEGLSKTLGQPMPDRDTPGSRAAFKAAPGAPMTPGTGVPMEQAAKGPDNASPGQRAAEGAGLSDQIKEAAEKAVAEIAGKN